MSKIQNLIKQLRTEPYGLSQGEISRRTGIGQPKLSRWENGEVAAGADDGIKLLALARQLGVDVSDIDQPLPPKAQTANAGG